MAAYAIVGNLDQLAANCNVKPLTVVRLADSEAMPLSGKAMRRAFAYTCCISFEGLFVVGQTALYAF